MHSPSCFFPFGHTCEYRVKELLLGNRRKLDFTVGTNCSNFFALYIILVLFLTLKYLDVRTLLQGKHCRQELPSKFKKMLRQYSVNNLCANYKLKINC